MSSIARSNGSVSAGQGKRGEQPGGGSAGIRGAEQPQQHVKAGVGQRLLQLEGDHPSGGHATRFRLLACPVEQGGLAQTGATDQAQQAGTPGTRPVQHRAELRELGLPSDEHARIVTDPGPQGLGIPRKSAPDRCRHPRIIPAAVAGAHRRTS